MTLIAAISAGVVLLALGCGVAWYQDLKRTRNPNATAERKLLAYREKQSRLARRAR